MGKELFKRQILLDLQAYKKNIDKNMEENSVEYWIQS